MPWEKSFDVDEALERATDVFWAKGYEATSLADLLEGTGINKGSFYNAFGSKKALFTKALLRYDREQRAATFAALEAIGDLVHAIGQMFEGLIEQCRDDRAHKGCFLINTALDLPNHDKDIAKAVKAGVKEIEAFFRRQIERGHSTGAIPDHVDAKETAKALVAMTTGLRVLSRGVYGDADLQAIKAKVSDLIT